MVKVEKAQRGLSNSLDENSKQARRDNYTLIKNELNMAFNSSSQSHDKWITLLLQRYYDKLYQHKLDTSKRILFSAAIGTHVIIIFLKKNQT